MPGGGRGRRCGRWAIAGRRYRGGTSPDRWPHPPQWPALHCPAPILVLGKRKWNVDELLTFAVRSRNNPSNHLTPLASQAAGDLKAVLHDGSDHLDVALVQERKSCFSLASRSEALRHRLMLLMMFRGQGCTFPMPIHARS